ICNGTWVRSASKASLESSITRISVSTRAVAPGTALLAARNWPLELTHEAHRRASTRRGDHWDAAQAVAPLAVANAADDAADQQGRARAKPDSGGCPARGDAARGVEVHVDGDRGCDRRHAAEQGRRHAADDQPVARGSGVDAGRRLPLAQPPLVPGRRPDHE